MGLRARVTTMAAWLLLSAAPGACAPAPFACENSGECRGGAAGGVCQAEGWCSFPDGACESGQRYGDLAGDGLAGTCVPPAGGTGEGGDDAGGTTGVATITATGAATVTSLEDGSEGSGTTDRGESTAGAVCGDGMIDAGEACDDGELNGSGGPCRGDCQLDVCGDGYVGPDEACDGTPGCSKRCTLAVCGNGVIERGEACDDAAPTPSCVRLGYTGGMAGCVDCMLDLGACEGCGRDGCSFAPCDGDAECEPGEFCVQLLQQGMCTGVCNDAADCGAESGVVCLPLEGEPVCVLTCEDPASCPPGLTCFAMAAPPVCI